MSWPWLVLTFAAVVQTAATDSSPDRAAQALFLDDQAFSSRAARLPLAEGLGPMFADDVIMPGPPATLHRGRDAVVAFLRASPDAAARASWTPIRVGLSADGQHGFTFGFMTLTHTDGRTVPLKYMAYWVKTPQGWRVAGYKRARRPEGEAVMTTMAPHLPAALVAPRSEASHIEPLRQSLVAAERAFSDAAQKIGLGPAFAQFGHPTAVNMGGPANPSYVVGADAIGTLVGGGRPPGPPSPVEWSCDVALVASSGDLGISFGFIRPNERPAGTTAPPQGTPFFTIWTRPSPGAAWRYIAE
jgi:Domain of unknown function (DUF4440)